MKVIIIDDEEDLRTIASMSLGIFGGVEVVEADSGPAGIAKAAHEKPDLVLLDATMPGMDGPATLAALQKNPDTANIPVVFMTAKAINYDVESLKKLGAKAVLPKPFDPETLICKLRDILENK